MWQYYNPNPAGRAVGDCAIRALSAALGVPWEDAYALVAKNGYEMGDMPSSNSVWGAVLRQHGFSRFNLADECSGCYTFEKFAKENPVGVYVLGTGTHVATVKDGVIYDAWDSSQEIPAFVWFKSNREER